PEQRKIVWSKPAGARRELIDLVRDPPSERRREEGIGILMNRLRAADGIIIARHIGGPDQGRELLEIAGSVRPPPALIKMCSAQNVDTASRAIAVRFSRNATVVGQAVAETEEARKSARLRPAIAIPEHEEAGRRQ